MRVFKVKLSSRLNYSLATIAIVLTFMSIGLYMGLTNVKDIYYFPLAIVGISALVFFPDLVSTATTEWIFAEKEITVKWLSQFLFQKRQDTIFKFENIQQYLFQPQRHFSFFKLTLDDGSIYKYWHSDRLIGYEFDEFDGFLSYFQMQVSKFNESHVNIVEIMRGKTIYEKPGGIVYAVVLAIILIAFPILVIVLNPDRVQWLYVVPAYFAGFYFISQVIKYWKKKKAKPGK